MRAAYSRSPSDKHWGAGVPAELHDDRRGQADQLAHSSFLGGKIGLANQVELCPLPTIIAVRPGLIASTANSTSAGPTLLPHLRRPRSINPRVRSETVSAASLNPPK